MSDSLTSEDFTQYTPEQRLNYLLKACVANKQIWILTDQDGCVMLNTDDEDCAPIWPSEATAKAWATGEWADCVPQAIDLKTWFARWTLGLEEDDVAVAVFPDEKGEGLIMSSQELEFELQKQ